MADPQEETAGRRRIEELQSGYSGLPADYTTYLAQVGWGEIGDSDFMIYEGPVPPQTIWGSAAPTAVRHLLLIGDDFSGHVVGFRTADWKIVEAEPSGGHVQLLAATFEQFIRQRIGSLVD